MREWVLHELDDAGRAELDQLGCNWLDEAEAEECRAALRVADARFVQRQVLPALCPQLHARDRQEAALPCGVVRAIADAVLVSCLCNDL